MKTQLMIAAAIALGAPALAHAAPAITQDDQRQVVVSYADLNLASPAGQAALKTRIRRAADTVCERPDNRDIPAMQRFHDCMTKTIGAATAAVPAATQVAAANGHNG